MLSPHHQHCHCLDIYSVVKLRMSWDKRTQDAPALDTVIVWWCSGRDGCKCWFCCRETEIWIHPHLQRLIAVPRQGGFAQGRFWCPFQWVYRVIKKDNFYWGCAFRMRSSHSWRSPPELHKDVWWDIYVMDGHFLILRGRGTATNWAWIIAPLCGVSSFHHPQQPY